MNMARKIEKEEEVNRTLLVVHLNAEEIAQADLINVVGNELVVHQVSSRNIAVARLGRNIRLKSLISMLVCLQIIDRRTIVVPARSGWTQPASFHLGGAVVPFPQVEWLPCFLARSPAL